jgi:pimeloyl-ACP methyl ester carboxylesterase
MASELSPAKSSELALGIYDINSGDERRLKAFLSNKLFEQSGSSHTKLKGAVGGRLLRAATDGFGLCAKGAGQYQNDLFLIFRGTTTANNKADFVTDARIGISTSKTGLPVHIGFNHTFNSMLPDIRKFVLEARSSGTIHCIGHSLGGAVASLAADWISKNTLNIARLYSFGAPRVGTDWFVKSTTSSIGSSNMYRVYHRTDPVPMVALYPYMQAPYQHTGHFIYSAEPLTSGAAHMMAKYVRSVSGKDWAQLSAAPDQPYSIEAAIESWLKSKSPVDSSSASFWRWVDSALIYVIKKVAMASILHLQGAFIGAFTLADKIAYILAKGIDLAQNISMWVEHLMRKLMQALGMRVASSKKELTRDLIRQVLRRITEKSSKDASNALRNL